MKSLFVLSALLLSSVSGFCAPVISSVSGTVDGIASDSNANVLTINLSGGGTKSEPRPWIWADFEASTNPTNLGYRTTWSSSNNIESTTSAGGYVFSGSKALGSTDGWKTDIFRVRVSTTADAIGRGGWWFVSKKTRVTFQYVDMNLKDNRYWDTNGTSASGNQYPNMYWSTQGTARNSRIIALERNPDAAKTFGVTGNWRHWAEAGGGWRTEQQLVKINSDVGLFDGAAYSYQFITSSGSFFASSTTWSTDSANAPGLFDEVSIQVDPSNITTELDGDARVFMDDVYVDFTPSRVVLSDTSTWSGGVATNVNVNMQIPFEWSDTQIKVYANTAGFTQGQTVYLFVFDSTNTPNTEGFPLTVGQAAVNPSDYSSTRITGLQIQGLTIR